MRPSAPSLRLKRPCAKSPLRQGVGRIAVCCFNRLWTRPNAKSKRLALTSLVRRPIKSAASAKRIEVAKAAVAALPPPQSATPLADYTGVPEWLFDVLEALTLSFAINLPASTLVALGVKMGRPRLQIQEATERTVTIEAIVGSRKRAQSFAAGTRVS